MDTTLVINSELPGNVALVTVVHEFCHLLMGHSHFLQVLDEFYDNVNHDMYLDYQNVPLYRQVYQTVSNSYFLSSQQEYVAGILGVIMVGDYTNYDSPSSWEWFTRTDILISSKLDTALRNTRRTLRRIFSPDVLKVNHNLSLVKMGEI
jgi:hypothetical protein